LRVLGISGCLTFELKALRFMGFIWNPVPSIIPYAMVELTSFTEALVFPVACFVVYVGFYEFIYGFFNAFFNFYSYGVYVFLDFIP